LESQILWYATSTDIFLSFFFPPGMNCKSNISLTSLYYYSGLLISVLKAF
jgi:hypothetical protein